MRVRQADNSWTRRPQRPAVAGQVAEIVADVRAGGDAAVRRLTERFDRAELAPEELRVDARELEASVGVPPPEVIAGLRTAIANVRAVVDAQLRESVALELEAGQRVEVAEVPLRRAGIYVPGGRAPYPSTVVMCAATARAAGVPEIAVCAPPGPEGRAHPVILAACVLCGVTEVYRMGGAQAVAALAYGTESVAPVDVIVGPGNAYVQEAKRQLVGQVGIDGIAGPSELVLVADPRRRPRAGRRSISWPRPSTARTARSGSSPPTPSCWRRCSRRSSGWPPSAPAPPTPSSRRSRSRTRPARWSWPRRSRPSIWSWWGRRPRRSPGACARAGCLFVGPGAGTAFGDYVAGTNHVLPTGGAARFQSALSAATFRRRMARVSLPGEAPGRLAPAGAALARAEGFPVHAESMERRA